MKECVVKDVNIGVGKPKICLPIVGKNNDEIIDQALSLKNKKFDVVELRIDFYENICHHDLLVGMLEELRKVIEQPILLTYRSLKEGGQIQLDDEQYKQLIQTVCASGYIDLVDIELMSGNLLVYQLVEIAHQHNIKVIISNHDFEKTPSNEEMMERLDRMELMNADICKIAVMPQSKDDVIRLLNVTHMMSSRLSKPLITMAMGSLGIISRICGECFGSALTFACNELASAPGQINVDDMNFILEVLNND